MISAASATPTRSGITSIVSAASFPTTSRSSSTQPSREVPVTSTNIGASKTCAYHRPPNCHILARTGTATPGAYDSVAHAGKGPGPAPSPTAAGQDVLAVRALVVGVLGLHRVPAPVAREPLGFLDRDTRGSLRHVRF